MRRSLAIAVLAFASLVSSRAVAQLAVADASNVIQTTATALNTARQVQQMVDQLRTMEKQFQAQLRALQTLDPTSFAGVERALSTVNGTYAVVQGDVNMIKWDMSSIQRDFDQLFPKKWTKFRSSDYGTHYASWNSEVSASAKAAMHAQASIGQLQDANRVAADALAQSKSADGEVRQLQLLNQQLAVLQTQLTILVNNIATTGRITASMAAASASEKQAQQDLSDQLRQGYTDRGPPSTVLRKMP